MNTHTIRWNGDKTHRIVTFTKSFEKKLLKAHPQAIRVFLDLMRKYFIRETNRTHAFDYDQMERIEERLKADLVEKEDGYGLAGWVYKVETTYIQHIIDIWIQDGARLNGIQLPNALEALDFAYNRLFPLEGEQNENV